MKTKIAFLAALFAAAAFIVFASDLPTRLVGDSTPTNSMIFSPGPCTFIGLYGMNTNANSVYIQIHQTNTIPATGARADFSVLVLSNQFFWIEPGAGGGVAIDYGVAVVSTTPFEYTPSPTNCSLQAIFSQQVR